MHFAIRLHENADGSFTAYRYEQPNFATEGKNYEDAMVMARCALSDLLEVPFDDISVHDQDKQVRVIGRVLFDEETGERTGLMPYDDVVLVNIEDIIDDGL